MRKLLPSLLIAIMALSVLSCAGMVSAQAPKATVQPQVIRPSTPQYYAVTAAPGKTYVFGPGHYDYYGTSLDRNVPGVATATASPNTGNLYVYASSKSAYTYEYAEALNGVNLLINAPTTGATATYVTVTVRMRATLRVQVANPLYAWGEMGMFATYSNGYGPYYAGFTTTGNGLWTINQPMTLGFPINPAAGQQGWFTGNYYQVGGYVNAQLVGGTTGTVSVQGQVQFIELQFS